jgi:hypothetical protein
LSSELDLTASFCNQFFKFSENQQFHGWLRGYRDTSSAACRSGSEVIEFLKPGKPPAECRVKPEKFCKSPPSARFIASSITRDFRKK